MDQPFRDLLKQHATGHSLPPDQLAEALEAACLRFADLLGACDPAVRQDLLAHVRPHILALLEQKKAGEAPAKPAPAKATDDGRNGAPPPDWTAGPQPRKLTLEEMEWARQLFNEEEFLEGMRDIEATGGLELHEFIHELEKAAGHNE